MNKSNKKLDDIAEPAVSNWVKPNKFTRMCLNALGWTCVVLGVAGAVLPLMPTTPFLLLALWAFARSSPRFKHWLWNNKMLGPYVRDWVAYHVVPIQAKILAVVTMTVSLGYVIFFTRIDSWIIVAIALMLGGVASFLLTRPSAPPGS